MTTQGLLVRLRASMLAAGIGWVAALLATLPMPLFKVWTNVIGGWRPLLWSLGAGAAVWIVWTLSMVAAAWLLAALPAAILVREKWLMEHKRWSVTISAALAWLAVLTEFQFWRFLTFEYHLDTWLFTLYSLLFVIFASTASLAYLRLIARAQASKPVHSAPDQA